MVVQQCSGEMVMAQNASSVVVVILLDSNRFGVMVFSNKIGINLFRVMLYLGEFTGSRKAANSFGTVLECP